LETAALLKFPTAVWENDLFIREQDIGQFTGASHADRAERFSQEVKQAKRDGFYFCAPGGESIAQCIQRVDVWLNELQKTCSGLRVLAVCHGNILKALIIRLERLNQTDWTKFEHDDAYKTFNCQVIHFSRRNPFTGEIHSKFAWVKSVCPVKLDRSKNEWRSLSRVTLTNEEILSIVEQTPRSIRDEDFEKIKSAFTEEEIESKLSQLTL